MSRKKRKAVRAKTKVSPHERKKGRRKSWEQPMLEKMSKEAKKDAPPLFADWACDPSKMESSSDFVIIDDLIDEKKPDREAVAVIHEMEMFRTKVAESLGVSRELISSEAAANLNTTIEAFKEFGREAQTLMRDMAQVLTQSVGEMCGALGAIEFPPIHPNARSAVVEVPVEVEQDDDDGTAQFEEADDLAEFLFGEGDEKRLG